MSSFITAIQQIKPVSFTDDKSTNTGSVKDAVPFSNMLSDAIKDYETSQKTADDDSNALALGNSDNLAQVQIDSLKAQTALQTTVQLTSRMVSAYKEIMQMQV
jgi:flagellar hook-basal body complex protein FliE